jgi:hypothetical protein
MKTAELIPMKDEDTQDFAIAGVFGGHVVLEANEWDLSLGVYRVVTLYLNPEHALMLSEQLASCAVGATPDGATAH